MAAKQKPKPSKNSRSTTVRNSPDTISRSFVLFCMVMIAVCAALGVWQLERMQWKEGLIYQLHDNYKRPVNQGDLEADLNDLNFRKIYLNGLYDTAHVFLMPGKMKGGVLGSDIYTLFKPMGGEMRVLVNRGWVPYTTPEDFKAANRIWQDVPWVEGHIRIPQGRGWFIPDNRLEDGFIHNINLEEIAGFTGKALQPYYIVHDPVSLTGPQGHGPQFNIPNNHMQYALTWFGLAAALWVMMLVYILKRRRK